MLDKIKVKLMEPGTHTGVGIVLAVVYPFIPYPYSWILAGVASVFGFNLIVRKG